MNEPTDNQYHTDRFPAVNKPAKGLELPEDNTTVTYNGSAVTVTSNKTVPYGMAGASEQSFPFTYTQGEPK